MPFMNASDRKAWVQQWVSELKRSSLARKSGRCMYCTERPSLGREKTEEGDRAIFWCKGCQRPAYGRTSSYANVAMKTLYELPIVIEVGPVQGSLL